MDGDASRQHWIALDAVFSRTMSADDVARARRTFGDYVEAVNDVSLHQLLKNPPAELRSAVIALRHAMQSTWKVREER